MVSNVQKKTIFFFAFIILHIMPLINSNVLHAENPFDEAHIRFDISRNLSNQLSLKIHNGEALLHEHALSHHNQFPANHPQCFIQNREQGFEIRYCGPDKSQLDFLVDRDGNIILTNNRHETALHEKKTWGFRTFGSITNLGVYSFYKLYTVSRSLLNHNFLYTAEFSFRASYIHNSGVHLYGYHAAGPRWENYQQYINNAVKPVFKPHHFENFGLFSGSGINLNATNLKIINYKFAYIDALALKGKSSIISFGPFNLYNLIAAEQSSIHNHQFFLMGSISAHIHFREIINQGILVYLKRSPLRAASIINYGNLVPVLQIKADQAGDNTQPVKQTLGYGKQTRSLEIENKFVNCFSEVGEFYDGQGNYSSFLPEYSHKEDIVLNPLCTHKLQSGSTIPTPSIINQKNTETEKKKTEVNSKYTALLSYQLLATINKYLESINFFKKKKSLKNEAFTLVERDNKVCMKTVEAASFKNHTQD